MSTLHISCWNIQGLYSSTFGIKSIQPEFLENIENVDILILTETWCRTDMQTHCPKGYHEIVIPSLKNKNVNHGRDSGGILVWYREKLANHISITQTGKSHCWVELKSNSGMLTNNLYLCAIYIPPIDSPYYEEEYMNNLYTDISHFQAQGNVLLCGDLNARTGSEIDFLDTQGNIHVFGQNHMHLSPNLLQRNSLDHVINKNGKELVHLCRTLGLYMLNGRIRGDSLGRFTCCSPLGASVVDYAVTDLDPNSFRAFTVRQQTPLTDHNQINVFLKIAHQPHMEPIRLIKINKPYKWTQDSPENFLNALNSAKLKSTIEFYNSKVFEISEEGVNNATEELNRIFLKAAHTAGMKKSNKKRVKNKIEEVWFDNECKQIRKKLRLLSNLKHHHPDDANFRKDYHGTLKHYKWLLRKKKQNYTNTTLDKIEESLNTNQFWEVWNGLSKTKSPDLPIQDGEIWRAHFENLFKEIPPHELHSNYKTIREKLISFENTIKDSQNPLDFPITEFELECKIKHLKANKSCGPDNIRGEMIKNSTPELQRAILKLFNTILTSGCYPDIWSKGYITPIHKNGDKLDPNNFRGICVNSSLGKVFSSILNDRIAAFLKEHNVLSKSQIGFLPNFRTTDHIYTLHTLITKHVHQTKRGKIFACFVDFQKAFDSIWHEGLYYKLLQSGVGGKVYQLIKEMYSKNKNSVKIGNNSTESFPQHRGVRQGCNLSPTLFNLYINELAMQLEQCTAPGLTLLDKEVKCLLYADDLVLLSPTPEGLQQQLNLLESYCQNWALTVNLKKTNIMVFQKKPRCQEARYHFNLGSTSLDHTMKYTYLGLPITPSGSFCLAVNALKDKARRALYAIRRKFWNIDIPIRIWCKIFDCVIQPIALYGSEIWGPLSEHSYTRWDKHPIETLHAEFCRLILKIQKKTPTNACRAELGRYPLAINIQKRALKFWMHLQTSPTDTLHSEAAKSQALNPEKSHLCQLVLRLTDPHLTHTDISQTSTASKLNVNKIIQNSKDKYLDHWQNETKTQSKLECYRTIKTNYELEEYLFTVRDIKQRQILTKYRLSDHSLALEKGRRRQSWLPREQRICAHCTTGEVETEAHFLLQCDKYSKIREAHFNKFNQVIPGFPDLNTDKSLSILLGQQGQTATLAAKYVSACHRQRDIE